MQLDHHPWEQGTLSCSGEFMKRRFLEREARRSMISFSEAKNIVRSHITALPPREVEFTTALGRILAIDLFSHDDIPLFDNSAMDGYAVIAENTTEAGDNNPARLEVVESIFAGQTPRIHLEKGHTARIMTGGVIPGGADSVVVQENTRSSGSEVLVLQPVAPGQNVRYKGEDCKSGELILQRNTLVGPAEIGMMATLGITRVQVIPSPRVAVLATGDELVEPWNSLAPGKLRNSNSYSIGALVSTCGGVPELLGIAKDTRDALREKIEKALSSADMVITIAGVSVGEGDLVKDTLNDLGAEQFFWQTAIRPGKPTAFGKVHGIPYFCLPGNPVSCMVTFLQFVSPALYTMQGMAHRRPETIQAVMEHDIEKKKNLRYFYRVKIRQEGDRFLASSTGPQGSGVLTSMTRAHGLAVLPEEREILHRGEEVVVELFGQYGNGFEPPGRQLK